MWQRSEARLLVSRTESPRILLWGALLVVVSSLLAWAEEPEGPVVIHALDLATVIVMVVCGVTILRRWTPDPAAPWLMAAGAIGLGLSLIIQMSIQPKAVGFAYFMVVIIALGPIILAWKPWGTASAILLAGVWGLAAEWPLGHAGEWILVACVGVVASALLLTIRLRSIDDLADARAQMAELATIDALTGVLNRHGLTEQSDRVIAHARRVDSRMFAVFIDVQGLKAANDRHGHAFGDEVIAVAARTVVENSRGEDLIARWGGDEIVVVGVGDHPDPDALAERLLATVDASGIDRAKWPGELSVGVAHARPEERPLSRVIEDADEDMYRRRQVRRGTGSMSS